MVGYGESVGCLGRYTSHVERSKQPSLQPWTLRVVKPRMLSGVAVHYWRVSIEVVTATKQPNMNPKYTPNKRYTFRVADNSMRRILEVPVAAALDVVVDGPGMTQWYDFVRQLRPSRTTDEMLQASRKQRVSQMLVQVAPMWSQDLDTSALDRTPTRRALSEVQDMMAAKAAGRAGSGDDAHDGGVGLQPHSFPAGLFRVRRRW